MFPNNNHDSRKHRTGAMVKPGLPDSRPTGAHEVKLCHSLPIPGSWSKGKATRFHGIQTNPPATGKILFELKKGKGRVVVGSYDSSSGQLQLQSIWGGGSPRHGIQFAFKGTDGNVWPLLRSYLWETRLTRSKGRH